MEGSILLGIVNYLDRLAIVLPSKSWNRPTLFRPAFENLERRHLLTSLTELEPNDNLDQANDLVFTAVEDTAVEDTVTFSRAQINGRIVNANPDVFRLRAFGGDIIEIRLYGLVASNLHFKDANGREFEIGHDILRQFVFEVPPDQGGVYHLELVPGVFENDRDYTVTVLRSRGASVEPGHDYSNHLIHRASDVEYEFGADAASARIFGTLMLHHSNRFDENEWDQDLIGLGDRDAGDSIRLSGFVPDWSDADPWIEVIDESERVLSSHRFDDPIANTVFESSGNYYVRVSATKAGGHDSQYILDLELHETVRPYVISVDGLPETVESVSDLIAGFAIEFSEPVRPIHWSDPLVDLREAGVDAVFGTEDDRTVAMTMEWMSDSKVTMAILDAARVRQALQPGRYQLTLTSGLVDRAGNRVAPMNRVFAISSPPEFTVVESEPNDDFQDARELVFRERIGAVDILESEVGIGLSENCGIGQFIGCGDWWRFELRAGDVMSLRSAGQEPGEYVGMALFEQSTEGIEPRQIDVSEHWQVDRDSRSIKDFFVQHDTTFYVYINKGLETENVQYTLQAEVQRALGIEFPTIAGIRSLPEEGTTADRLIDRFMIDLSHAVAPASLNADGVEIVSAGNDRLFDTADDQLVLTNSRLVYPPWRIEVRFADGPLRPGDYRIQFSDLVTDHQGNRLDSDMDGVEGGVFTRKFTVPALLADRVLETASPPRLELRQDTAGTELYRANIGYGSIFDRNDTDWWQVDVLAGDQIVVDGISTVGSTLGEGIGVAVKLFELADDGISPRYLDDEQFLGGRAGACSARATISDDRTLLVRVTQHNPDQFGDYELRIHVARTSQLEGDFPLRNNGPGSTDELFLASGEGGAVGKFAGILTSDDDTDFWQLGHLQAGSKISVDASAVADWSGVAPVARIHKLNEEDDTVRLLEIDGNTTKSTTSVVVEQAGRFVVEIKANLSLASSQTGLDAAYLARVQISETVPPQIVSTDNLPLPWLQLNPLFSTFVVNFDERINPLSFTDTSYELRGGGRDLRFGTAYDELYSLSAEGIPEEHAIRLTVDSGPLPPGVYRLELNENVTDLNGNGLDANGDGETGGVFSYEFRVGPLPEYSVLEQPYNDHFTGYTLLDFGPIDANGTGWERTPQGFGVVDPLGEADWWAVNVESGDVVDFFLTEHQGGFGAQLTLFRFDSQSHSLEEIAKGESRSRLSEITQVNFTSGGIFFLSVQAKDADKPIEYSLVAQKNAQFPVEVSADYLEFDWDLAESVHFEPGDGIRHASIAGSLDGHMDFDLFSLGYLNPGDVVHLDASLISQWSVLPATTRLSFYQLAPEDPASYPMDQLPEDERFRAEIADPGYYYATVYTRPYTLLHSTGLPLSTCLKSRSRMPLHYRSLALLGCHNKANNLLSCLANLPSSLTRFLEPRR